MRSKEMRVGPLKDRLPAEVAATLTALGSGKPGEDLRRAATEQWELEHLTLAFEIIAENVAMGPASPLTPAQLARNKAAMLKSARSLGCTPAIRAQADGLARQISELSPKCMTPSTPGADPPPSSSVIRETNPLPRSASRPRRRLSPGEFGPADANYYDDPTISK
jgi:hypothetical protein